MKLAVTLAVAIGTTAFAQDHHAGVKERGDHAMGFSHEKTAHHFRLLKDGGAIQVAANDPKDTASRNEIRDHLTHVARMFSSGNFKVPMLIHDQVPPGVSVMKERKKLISYRFESTEHGGQVRISTTDEEALKAVHEFLRFQIFDHQTGDSTAVRASGSFDSTESK